MKKLITIASGLALIVAVHAQININFENASLEGWTASEDNHWEISPESPLSGLYSLHHAFDNPSSGTDQIGFGTDILMMEKDTVSWFFRLKYGYNPSSSNHFGVFLASKGDPHEMLPKNNNPAYIIGVNLSGSDDSLAFYYNFGGSIEIIQKLNLNWQNDIATDSITGIKVSRYPGGEWHFFMAHDHEAENFLDIGTAYHAEMKTSRHTGFYYKYSSTQDRKLWVDDVHISRHFEQDTIPPSLVSVKVHSSNSLELVFSEPPAHTNEDLKLKIKVNSLNKADSVFASSPMSFIVYFSQAFVNEAHQYVYAENMEDEFGNMKASDSLAFFYYHTKPYDVVINELMPDPNPPEDLPLAEYIEIYNRTNYNLSLKDWILLVNGNSISLPDSSLLPGEFALLIHPDYIFDFLPFGKIIPLLGSQSILRNAYGYVNLKNELGIELDSIYYDLTLYGNDVKSNGGWSIERIRIDSACKTYSNWQASIDISGGTPGKINSHQLPAASKHPQAVDSIWFSGLKEISLSFLFQPDTALLNEVGILSSEMLDTFYWTNNGSLLMIMLQEIPEDGKSCSVEINNLKDACNFRYDEEYFITAPSYAPPGSIQISEIMFDPSPSAGLPEFEYLEVKNISDKTVHFKQSWLKINETSLPLENISIKPDSFHLFIHGNAVAAFGQLPNASAIFKSLYELPNGGANISIINERGLLIDSAFYADSLIFSNAHKSNGGYSIEPVPDYANCMYGHKSWLYSHEEIGGTPGYVSQFIHKQPVKPKIFIDSANFADPITIAIGMDNNLNHPQFINMDVQVSVAWDSVKYFSNENTCRIYLAEIPDDSALISLKISGIYDACGFEYDSLLNIQAPSYAPPGSIQFTEIMFDPSPSAGLPEFEYLEVKNVSDKTVHFKNALLKINETSLPLENISIKPDSFHLFIHGDAVAAFGQLPNASAIFKSLYELPNGGAHVSIINERGELIDSAYYADSMLYHQENKDNGGFSIEPIPEYAQCMFADKKWIYSHEEIGGTPGNASQFIYQQPVKTRKFVDSVYFSGANTIDLEFSHEINTPLFINMLTNTSVPIDSFKYFDKENNWRIYLSEIPKDSSLINIKISGIQDACGFKYDSVIHLLSPAYAEKGAVLITEIMADPLPSAGLPEYEYLEIQNISNKNIDLKDWHLEINTNKLYLGDLMLGAGHYAVLTHPKGQLEFGVGNVSTPFSSIYQLPNEQATIKLFNNKGSLVDSVYYRAGEGLEAEGGYALERIPNHLQCSFNGSEWIYSLAEEGGTPGYVNLIDRRAADNAPPEVDTIIYSRQNIKIYYNEPVAPLAGTSIAINNIHFQPEAAQEENVLIAHVDNQLENGIKKVRLSPIEDHCGNQSETNEHLALIYDPAPLDVIISEFYPNPGSSYPAFADEYVEIHNLKNHPVYFDTLTLTIGNSKRNIYGLRLDANSYWAIGDTEGEDKEKIPNYISVASFPSLSNTQGTISLKSGKTILHQLEYRTEWYDPLKTERGGYAIELVNIAQPCQYKKSYQYSTDADGGTPGKENSQQANKPDITPPLVLQVVPEKEDVMQIFFDEPILIPEMPLLQYIFEPGINYRLMEARDFSLSHNIQLTENLVNGQYHYLVDIRNATDCAGNPVEIPNEIPFVLPQKPMQNNVLFSEILFKSANNEFIEIYNYSEYTFNLKDLYIASVKNSDTAVYPLSENGWLFFPNQYLVFCKDKASLLQSFAIDNDALIIELESFPTLNDTEGYLLITDIDLNVIDAMYYHEKMHIDLLRDIDELSLERLRWDISALGVSNWHTASQESGYGTPGSENSQASNAENTLKEDEFFIEHEVFTPDNDGFRDVLEVQYNFSEPGTMLSLSIYDMKGRLFHKPYSNYLCGKSGFLYWDGRDFNGFTGKSGIYILWFEYFRADGTVDRQKLICVLGRR